MSPSGSASMPDSSTTTEVDPAEESAHEQLEQARAASTLTDFSIHLALFFQLRYHRAASAHTLLSRVTEEFVSWLDPDSAPMPERIEQDLLMVYNHVVHAENAKTMKGEPKIPFATRLNAWQIAKVMLRMHHALRITPSATNTEVDRELQPLALYRDSGPGRGTYTDNEEEIRMLARRYNVALTLNEFREVIAVMRELSEMSAVCSHRDLLPAANGVVYYGTEPLDVTIHGTDFHFEPKQVHPFHPSLVFLKKPAIDYPTEWEPEGLTSPVFTHADGTEWEIHSWLESLFDGEGQEGLADLIWEILGAIIRPGVRWGKSAWFYSTVGNNGKGTLCALMRNLVGDGAHTSIPLSDFGKDFALEPLARSSAIIVDENDVGVFIDKLANFKAVVTNEPIAINRKYKSIVAVQFLGFMVQCVNELPQTRDRTESKYRRDVIVPFEKSFTGHERRYIKDDYLQREELLEYVFWYVINKAGTSDYKGETTDRPGSYYTLSAPPATQRMLEEYRETNDPVRSFWDEIRELLVWDRVPMIFIYSLYRAWFPKNHPSGKPISRNRFSTELLELLRGDDEWYCLDRNARIRPDMSMMTRPEPLIAEYELRDWYTPGYTGTDRLKLCRPALKPNYRGMIQRTDPQSPQQTAAIQRITEALHKDRRDQNNSEHIDPTNPSDDTAADTQE